jgi:hypothetical protein
MDPALLHLNQCVAKLQRYPGSKEAQDFFNALLSNPHHLPGFWSIASESSQSPHAPVRRECAAFLRTLVTGVDAPIHLARASAPLCSLAADMDGETLSIALRTLSSILRPALIGVLRIPNDETSRVWSSIFEAIRRLPTLLEAAVVSAEALAKKAMKGDVDIVDPTTTSGTSDDNSTSFPLSARGPLLEFAEQVVVVFTPSYIPPMGTPPLPASLGLDLASANAVSCNSIPPNHPVVKPNALMSEAGQIVGAVLKTLGRVCISRSGLPISLDQQSNTDLPEVEDMSITWLLRITLLRPGFITGVCVGLFSFIKSPPNAVAGLTSQGVPVLLPSIQRQVKGVLSQLLLLSTSETKCPPELSVDIQKALTSIEMTSIAIKVMSAAPAEQLDEVLALSLYSEDLIDLLLANLDNVILNAPGDVSASSSAVLPAHVSFSLFADTISALEKRSEADEKSTRSVEGKGTLLALGPSGGTAAGDDDEEGPRGAVSVPSVAAWLAPSSLLLWANGDAKLAANDAAQRILYDACLPQWLTSDLGEGANEVEIADTRKAAALRSLFGSVWEESSDRLSTILSISRGKQESMDDQSLDLSSEPLSIHLAEELIQRTPAISSSSPEGGGPDTGLDITHLERLASMLLLAACKLYKRESITDGPPGEGSMYSQFVISSTSVLIQALRRGISSNREVAEILLRFVLDCPIFPSSAIEMIADLCYINTNGATTSTSQTSSLVNDLMERAALMALLGLLVLRPRQRRIVSDVLLALSIADSIGSTARRSALSSIGKRLMDLKYDLSSGRNHVVAFAFRALESISAGRFTLSEEPAAKRMKKDPSPIDTLDLPRLVSGCEANVTVCATVEGMISEASSIPYSAEQVSKIVKLWLYICAPEPNHLHDLLILFGKAITSKSDGVDLSIIIKDAIYSMYGPQMIAPGATSVSKRDPRRISHGREILSLALNSSDFSDAESALNGDDPSMLDSSSSLSPFHLPPEHLSLVVALIEAQCGTILRDFILNEKRTEEGGDVITTSSTTSTTLASQVSSKVLRESPDVQEVIKCLRKLTCGPLGTVSILLPAIPLLGQEELRSVLKKLMERGSANDIRYSFTRMFGSEFPPSLSPDEVMSLIITEADSINKQEGLEMKDKVQLLTAASNAIFQGQIAKTVFTLPVIVDGLRRIVEDSIARHSANKSLQPIVPVLLMRCFVITSQTFPASRSGVVELLSTLLRNCKMHLFEANSGLEQGGAVSGATPVWDGFVMLCKALVPISLQMVAELLDEPHLAAIVAKEGALAQRLKTWIISLPPTGQNNVPVFTRKILGV